VRARPNQPDVVRRRRGICYGLRPSQLPLRNASSCEGGQRAQKAIHLSTTGSASDRSPPRLKIQSARWLKIQSARTPLRDNDNYYPHSRLPSDGWDWCDLAQVKSADDRTAFLLRKEHFPQHLGWSTRERYALVLNVSPETIASKLIDKAYPSYIDARTNSTGKVIPCCHLRDGAPAIPFLENLSTLKLFRRFIPVIYLLANERLLIEYEWSMMANGNLCLREAREIEDRYACDSPADSNDIADALITQILPMPLGAGPKPKPQHAGPWNDAWSDCIPS
jgi:hypothetical protein